MDEVLLAHALFCVLRNFIGKGRQLLVFDKLELHLLVSEQLAQGTVVEKVNKEEASFVHLDVVAVDLHFLANLIDDLLVAVLARSHPDLILAILVSFEDVNHLERHGET